MHTFNFNTYINLYRTSGLLNMERTKELYRDLMSIFDKLVLPTHGSSHVQFILFYLCSFKLVSVDPLSTGQRLPVVPFFFNYFKYPPILKLLCLSAPQAFTEAFLDHQWKILQSPSQPAVLRQAAAGYLGSFLARAKFVPVS